MTEPLDDLTELTPTHASVLLLDPIDLADRAGRSARRARHRANRLVAVLSAAGVTIAVVAGSLLIQPRQATPAAAPSVRGAYPSSTPMSSWVPLNGGVEAADYAAPRVAIGRLKGGTTPGELCVHGLQTKDSTSCEATVAVTGLTWAQIPWATTGSEITSADAVVWGYYDGKSIRATTATRVEDTSISLPNPEPSPAAPTTSLIACDRTISSTSTSPSSRQASQAARTPSTGRTISSSSEAPQGGPPPSIDQTVSLPSSPSSSQSPSTAGLGSMKPGLTFPGLEAYWIDYGRGQLMVATSGSLDVAVRDLPLYWDGAACIGTVPASGPLADLIAAEKRVRAADIDGVTSVSIADYPGGVLQVNVVANVPGLRERVVAAAGGGVSLTIVPLLMTVA